MVTLFLFVINLVLFAVTIEVDNMFWRLLWCVSVLAMITTLFTGFPISNNQGQYKGYVTAVEQNGSLFKGWTAYLKTELESSDVDVACINRDDQALVSRLQKASEDKESLVLRYRGEIQFPIGVCPGADWMIVGVK